MSIKTRFTRFTCLLLANDSMRSTKYLTDYPLTSRTMVLMLDLSHF